MVKESVVERHLRDLVAKAGGMCVKIMPTVAGVPDRLVLLPFNRLFLVELKAPGGKLRPAQVVWHRKAAAIGITVVVLNSTAAVNRWALENNLGQ